MYAKADRIDKLSALVGVAIASMVWYFMRYGYLITNPLPYQKVAGLVLLGGVPFGLATNPIIKRHYRKQVVVNDPTRYEWVATEGCSRSLRIVLGICSAVLVGSVTFTISLAVLSLFVGQRTA